MAETETKTPKVKPAAKRAVKSAAKPATKRVPKAVKKPRKGSGATDTNVKEGVPSATLLAVFSDRLHQLIDRKPDLIRAGRGRTNDFKTYFNIHYTTAHRLVSGIALPSADLLIRIAEEFDVTVDWLLGRGDPDVDDLLDRTAVKIHIFDPRSALSEFATLPASQVPAGFDTSKLLFNRTFTDKGDDVFVVVKISAEAQEGKVHLIYDPLNKKTYLRRINVNPGSGDLFCVALGSGRSETIPISSIAFGKTSSVKTLSVVGQVVAQIAFAFKGD